MQVSAASTSICLGCGTDFVPKLPEQSTCDNCAGLAEPDEAPSPMQESVVGGHRLVQTLGGGRFSTTWLAEPEGGGGVVLKLLRAYAPDPPTVQRFVEESKRVSRSQFIDHPGVARLLDAGVQLSGSLFLVYESGGESTLADELRGRGRLPASRALELCALSCEALHALHQAGVRHLDLKPANLGLAREADGRETTVLLDAFTAHLLNHAGLRETGMLPLSTAAYLSPEESAGQVPDGRADLYAVGVLLYQLISGRLPIVGSTAEELIEAHKSQRALRLRDAGRRVVPELEQVVAQLLAKRPEDRFANGLEAARALRAVIPIADQVPTINTEEELDDPTPVIAGPSLEDELFDLSNDEPEVEPPKPLAALAAKVDVDPGLEQAMLGNTRQEHAPVVLPTVPDLAAAESPPLPAWLIDKRLWAGGAAALALVVTALAWPGAEKKARKAPQTAESRRSTTPPPVAKAPAIKAEPPPPAAIVPAEPAPESASDHAAKKGGSEKSAKADRPKSEKSENSDKPAKSDKAAKSAAKSVALLTPPPVDDTPPPIAAALNRVQRDLDSGKAAAATQTLTALLSRSDLNKSAQTRATRLMAEAEAKKGDKKAAVEWYRKYLRLTDKPEERARVVKEIQALSR